MEATKYNIDKITGLIAAITASSNQDKEAQLKILNDLLTTLTTEFEANQNA